MAAGDVSIRLTIPDELLPRELVLVGKADRGHSSKPAVARADEGAKKGRPA